jgi:hypothetical protein
VASGGEKAAILAMISLDLWHHSPSSTWPAAGIPCPAASARVCLWGAASSARPLLRRLCCRSLRI